jgi:hypothetical protein
LNLAPQTRPPRLSISQGLFLGLARLRSLDASFGAAFFDA